MAGGRLEGDWTRGYRTFKPLASTTLMEIWPHDIPSASLFSGPTAYPKRPDGPTAKLAEAKASCTDPTASCLTKWASCFWPSPRVTRPMAGGGEELFQDATLPMKTVRQAAAKGFSSSRQGPLDLPFASAAGIASRETTAANWAATIQHLAVATRLLDPACKSFFRGMTHGSPAGGPRRTNMSRTSCWYRPLQFRESSRTATPD